MDDTSAFIELSALLTGSFHLADNNAKRSTVTEAVAREYRLRLMAVFSSKLPVLLEAYKTLAAATPKPPIDDALLASLKALPAFTENVFVAKQIVNIWYFSQFKPEDKPDAPLIDGGRYEEGLVWPLIKAHPIGFSGQPHGYWSSQP